MVSKIFLNHPNTETDTETDADHKRSFTHGSLGVSENPKPVFYFYFICRKSERQIVPTKSQVHGHYLRNSSTTLPYTHFRRDIPDRACMRQEEYYIDSDDYLSPAPAPLHTRVERVPESSQWAQDGNEYSTPPDSDRYVHYGNALFGFARTTSVSSGSFN